MLYDPVIKNGEYLYRPDLKYEFPVEIHFTRMETFDDENSFKVLVLSNESMMSPNRSTVDDVVRYHQRYDLILCADDYIMVGIQMFDEINHVAAHEDLPPYQGGLFQKRR